MISGIMFPRQLQCLRNSTTQERNSSAVFKVSRVSAYFCSLTDPLFPNPLRLHQSEYRNVGDSQSLRSKSQLTNQLCTHKSTAATEIREWSRSVHDSLQDVGTPVTADSLSAVCEVNNMGGGITYK